MSARQFLLAGAVSMAALGATTAAAAPLNGAAQPLAKGKAAETVQVARMYWDGDWYCFYWDGWNGPGWYLCDQYWIHGYGWGGYPGWRGWRVPVRPRVHVPKHGPVIKGSPRVRIHRAPPVRTWGGGAAPRKMPGGTIHRSPSGPGAGKGSGGGGGGGSGGRGRHK